MSSSSSAPVVPETPGSHAIACMEVWGGNRKTESEVSLPGLAAWVYSEPLVSSAGGGDVYYLSVCNAGILSRVVLADVSGHGPGVNEVAERLRNQMHEHINTWDQSQFMRTLAEMFRRSEGGPNYATAVVLGFYRQESQLAFTLAGHPEPLWYQASEGRWQLLPEEAGPASGGPIGLPLGMIPGTNYHQSLIDFRPGDVLVLYTDALIEAEGPDGGEIGRDRLLDLAQHCPTNSPSDAGRCLVEQVRLINQQRKPDDDETLIVLQRLAERADSSTHRLEW